MSLSEVLRTARNGQITKLPSVYLRGSSVRFIALPEILKNAPVFQKVTAMKRNMEQAQQQRQQQQKQQGGGGMYAGTTTTLILCMYGSNLKPRVSNFFFFLMDD